MGDLETILAQLDGTKKAAGGWIARCPAHEDRHQSLSVGESEGRLLLHCHAGCTFEAIKAKLVWPERERKIERSTIVDTYSYVDEDGHELYQAVRMVPKDFRQRRSDGAGGWIWKLEDTRRVLYRLPQVVEAVAAGRRVFVCEGEKDVHTLEELGFVATTNAGGAGAWRGEYTESLVGAHVVALPDNDQSGEDHAEAVRLSLEDIAASISIVRLPGLEAKGDVTDWVHNGGTADELKRLVKAPPALPGDVCLLTAGLEWVRQHCDAESPIEPGIDYPWSKITHLTRGMRPGWLVYLAGYPGHGKTAAAIEIVVAVAKRGQRVLFISAEMGIEEIGVRVAQRWGLNSDDFYRGRPTSNEEQAAVSAMGMDAHDRVMVSHTNQLDRVEELVGIVKPDLLVIDYLGLMGIDVKERTEGTTRNSHRLKAMARKAHVPILCLVQLRREQDMKKERPPSMHDLKDSSSLEQDADQIVMVYRERNPTDRTPKPKGVFIVAKSRMGSTGSMDFEFDGARQTFVVVDRASDRAKEQGFSVYDGGQA